MKIGETTLAVVGNDNEVSGDGECATIGYGSWDAAAAACKKCDRLWKDFKPHRVVPVTLQPADTVAQWRTGDEPPSDHRSVFAVNEANGSAWIKLAAYRNGQWREANTNDPIGVPHLWIDLPTTPKMQARREVE